MSVTKIPRIRKCKNKNCENPGLAVDGFCMCHTRKSESSEWTITDITGIKNPFGMELECLGRDDNIRKVAECVVDDGSLSSYGHEIKILADATKIGKIGAITARKARALGARVNGTCGFHVHMSVNYTGEIRNRYSVADLLQPVARAIETEAFSLFPSRRNNTYCHSVRGNCMADHYSWLSLSGKFKTLECRIHPGTLSASKIIAWTAVCRGLQRLFQNVIDGEDTEIVKRAKDRHFIQLFRKGSVARHYLEKRKEVEGRMSAYSLTS